MLLPSHVYASPRYAYWRELLQHWIFQVERSYRVTGTEHPCYSYKERTNVGLLAATAVANGWVALEECGTEKRTSESDESSPGRSDLRLWREKRFHEIEAKFLRIALKSESSTRLERSAESSLEEAIRALDTGAKFSRRVALNFVVPTVSSAQYERLGEEHIRVLLADASKSILKSTKPSFFASAFPGKAPVNGQPKRVSLGIYVFGREPE